MQYRTFLYFLAAALHSKFIFNINWLSVIEDTNKKQSLLKTKIKQVFGFYGASNTNGNSHKNYILSTVKSEKKIQSQQMSCPKVSFLIYRIFSLKMDIMLHTKIQMFSVICILRLALSHCCLNGDYKSPVWCSCVGCRPMQRCPELCVKMRVARDAALGVGGPIINMTIAAFDKDWICTSELARG